MSRLIELPPEKLTEEQTAIFHRLVEGRGRILGPYKIWIHSPVVADGMERLGTYLNKRSSLSPREVEMTIVMIARHWQSDYVVQAHLREGRRVGLSGDILDDLIAGGAPSLEDAHERGVYRLADALIRGINLSDDQFGEIESAIGRPGIAEVLVLIGYYTSVALGMKIHGVSVPNRSEKDHQ
jgi:4-carboxymuconolactone decarboxylase